MPKLHFKKGLTLIELLVVISIIGILASLATFTYQDSQAKSRDTRRKSDLDAIRKALELAKQDSAGAFSYPSCDAYSSGTCVLSASDTNASSTDTGGSIPDLIGTNYSYIKSIPLDPKSNTGYTYIPVGAAANCGVGTCSRFSLVACLENTKDPTIDSTQNTTVCTVASGTKSFTITNL